MRSGYVFMLFSVLLSCSGEKHDAKMRESLLLQLRGSNSEENWFAPMHKAITGVTAEQAAWTDSSDNHSIGQLAAHLVFWNERALRSFAGNTPPDFQGSNDSTFTQLDAGEWSAMQLKLDSIQHEIERIVSDANDEQLEKWTPTINNLCMHNAYHTGQMVYIRKRNGWWKKS